MEQNTIVFFSGKDFHFEVWTTPSHLRYSSRCIFYLRQKIAMTYSLLLSVLQ